MRHLFSALFSMFICSSLFSQMTGLQWQRSLGGTNSDVASLSFLASDGGIIIIGSTLSNTGVVNSNHGGEDVWVMKLTKNGSLEWSKCFGGSGTDEPMAAAYKSGILTIAANSNSINGNVTNNHGSTDIWVFQLDALGNIVWQNSFGGSGDDKCNSIISVSFGGFAVSGYTNSSDGDVTTYHGGLDLWVLYISDAGSLQWQKALGGNSGEVSWHSKIIESNGSFLVGTETFSNNGDVSGLVRYSDIWLVKLNTAGILQWQKCLGGNGFDYFTDIGEGQNGELYILGKTDSYDLPSAHGINNDYNDIYLCRLSSSGSIVQQKCFGSMGEDSPVQMALTADGVLFSANVYQQSGDVTGLHGGYDIWMVKVKPDFTIEWQKALGGSGMDGTEPGNVNYKETTGRFIQTSDGNFLISGYTESPDNGDVTGYHPNPNIFDTARADLWIVSLSASGNLSWQRTYGGTKGDWPRGAPVEVNPNEFIITAFTNSNDYDITGANGSYDAWILKLGAINTIKGTLFVDYNLNGSKDLNEPYYSDAIVKSKKATDSISSIPYGGLFVNEVDTGNYITIPMVNQPYYTIVPSSASSNFTSYFNKDSFNFALQPIANKQDVVISIVPLSSPRPGFSSSFRLFYKNEGTTTIASGEVLFKKDARTTVLYTSSSVNSANGDTLKWNYTNFAPGDTASIIVNLQVSSPPTVNNGDTLFLKAIITPVTGDETPSNDTAILKQRVVGSFDPNDKIENNGGVVSSSFIANGDYLQYTVRFQNTGTAEAYFVTVRDTLGNRVDLNTLEVITASHPYTLSIENGNQLIWQFHNIMLPASSLDELGSHGYIVYRIRPKADVAVGETIHNTASIYFDYNLPVLTNDATTFVQDNSVVLPIQLTSFTGQLTNNTVQLNWKADEGRNFEKFEIERSLDGKVYNRIETVSFNNSINDYHVLDNIAVVQSKLIFYRLKMIDADGKFIYSRVVAFKLNSLQNNFTVYPNPARTEVFISMSANKAENLQVKVLDASGRVVSELRKQIQKGTNVFSLSTSKLRAANYVLQFVLNGETKISKLTIIN